MKYEINLNYVKKSFTSQKTRCIFITKTCQSVLSIQIIDDGGCGNDGYDDDDNLSFINMLV